MKPTIIHKGRKWHYKNYVIQKMGKRYYRVYRIINGSYTEDKIIGLADSLKGAMLAIDTYALTK